MKDLECGFMFKMLMSRKRGELKRKYGEDIRLCGDCTHSSENPLNKSSFINRTLLCKISLESVQFSQSVNYCVHYTTLEE